MNDLVEAPLPNTFKVLTRAGVPTKEVWENRERVLQDYRDDRAAHNK
jgi:hypothetical protein